MRIYEMQTKNLPYLDTSDLKCTAYVFLELFVA